MVNPPSSSGQPLGVHPSINQTCWGYNYPGTWPPIVNQDYQPSPSTVFYPIIPYPGNVFVPWGQPNQSNDPLYGGAFVNTIGGYGGPPRGLGGPEGPRGP